MFDNKLVLKDQMGGTYLIQRLLTPKNGINPFSFGGGLVNGGIKPGDMSVLSQVMSFDYMGSAEFEWGAVPAAIKFLAELSGNEKGFFPKKNRLVIGEYKKVFYLCPKVYEQGVKNLIDSLLENEYKLRLKEYCGLSDRLNNKGGEFRKDNVGWLELDNGFFFFTDEEMFKATAALFGINQVIEPVGVDTGEKDGVICGFCGTKSESDIGNCQNCGATLASDDKE